MEYQIKTYKENWKNNYTKVYENWCKRNRPHVHNDGHWTPPVFPDVNKATGLKRFVENMFYFLGIDAKTTAKKGKMEMRPEMQESGTILKIKKFMPEYKAGAVNIIEANIKGVDYKFEITNPLYDFTTAQIARVQETRNYVLVKDADSFCTALKIIFT